MNVKTPTERLLSVGRIVHMRRVATGELVLIAAVVALMDFYVALHLSLCHVGVGASPAPILALYATKAAVVAKSFLAAALMIAYLPIKLYTQKSPRFDKLIRTALLGYITFTYATFITLAFTLGPQSTPPTTSQIPQ
jgi:hypothetical protein